MRLDPFARNLDLEANPQLAVQRERFMRLWNGNGTGTGFYFAPQADLSMCQQEFFRRKKANQPYTSNLMKKKGYIWNYDLL